MKPDADQPLTALLDDLDGLRAKATPGPWLQDSTIVEGVDSGLTIVDCWEDPADAALIVAAVNALPRLVAALRAVETLAEEWESNAWRSATVFAPRTCADRLRAALAAALTSEDGAR